MIPEGGGRVVVRRGVRKVVQVKREAVQRPGGEPGVRYILEELR